MTISDLSKNNTILARYLVAETATKLTFIDVADDEAMRFDNKDALVTEPVLDVSLNQLKSFARDNLQGPILTQADLGDVATKNVRYNAEKNTFDAVGTGSTLSATAKVLNPFRARPDADKAEWAIDVQPDSDYTAEFIVFVPK